MNYLVLAAAGLLLFWPVMLVIVLVAILFVMRRIGEKPAPGLGTAMLSMVVSVVAEAMYFASWSSSAAAQTMDAPPWLGALACAALGMLVAFLLFRSFKDAKTPFAMVLIGVAGGYVTLSIGVFIVFALSFGQATGNAIF